MSELWCAKEPFKDVQLKLLWHLWVLWGSATEWPKAWRIRWKHLWWFFSFLPPKEWEMKPTSQVNIFLDYIKPFQHSHNPHTPLHLAKNVVFCILATFCSLEIMMSKKHLPEKEAQLRQLVESILQACFETGVEVNPLQIDPKKTIGTCTRVELLAHVLYLFDQYDTLNVSARPRKAHYHLDCIGVCIKCIPAMQ